jgi:hypothetical protein
MAVRRSSGRADVVTAASLRQREQPLAFVENRHVFADLVDDARFVASYTRALSGLLNQGGIRAVIDGLAAEGPETQRSVVTTAPTSGNRRAYA